MDVILCKKLDLFPYNKSALNSMEHPPTCKESTTPDTALLHPTLTDLLLSILVDKQGFFDTHSPVIFKLQLPSQQISRKTFFGILPLGFPFRLIKMTLKEFFLSPLGKMEFQQHWKSGGLVENALQGNTSPMDGIGYSSAHISNANFCCLFDPCLVFPAGDMYKMSSKVRLYPIQSTYILLMEEILWKLLKKVVIRISSINSSCRGDFPFCLLKGILRCFADSADG